MPRLMMIYGTRPEAIKMAPVVRALESVPAINPLIAVTGQHREMLDQVNSVFDIVPDFDLNIIEPRQTLVDITARALVGISEVLKETKPDAVMVQGDTTTSFVGGLAAFYQQIPVIHLEAGLRSGDRYAPFPEEGNRKLTGQLTDLHLAPTQSSKNNLRSEGVNADDIVVTGNTVIDALIHAASKDERVADEALENVLQSSRKIILVTMHRRENLGTRMHVIGRAIAEIAMRWSDVAVVLPIHKNPAVREAVLPHVSALGNVIVTEPLAYGDFTRVLGACEVVLTDSGGVQEEAPTLGKPVLVMRDNTERPEAVEAGAAKLVGTSFDSIVSSVAALLDDEVAYRRMASAVNPYGDGRAAARVVAATAELLGVGSRLPDFAWTGRA